MESLKHLYTSIATADMTVAFFGQLAAQGDASTIAMTLAAAQALRGEFSRRKAVARRSASVKTDWRCAQWQNAHPCQPVPCVCH